MSKDFTGKQAMGCIMAVLALLVSLPLWYVILFYLLYTTQAPPWIWVAYWVYVPIGLIVGILQQALRLGNGQE